MEKHKTIRVTKKRGSEEGYNDVKACLGYRTSFTLIFLLVAMFLIYLRGMLAG